MVLSSIWYLERLFLMFDFFLAKLWQEDHSSRSVPFAVATGSPGEATGIEFESTGTSSFLLTKASKVFQLL